jgi:hypothetical protein
MRPGVNAEITRIKDGRTWRIGGADEVRWIQDGTHIGLAITSAIPPVFEAYATIALSEADRLHQEEAQRHEPAMLTVLTQSTPSQPWWLGYLETGGSDVVFPDAPKVELYAGWQYVLVQAGPQQAASWRSNERERAGALPDLMFPSDRSWLVSTLWDDDWTCVGGSAALVQAFLRHPDLRRRARRVSVSDKDATPPGHVAR